MPGFCWIFVFSSLLLGLTLGIENTNREKVYQNQSLPAAANETQPDFKQKVRLTMEGQPMSLNPSMGKINSKVKKESRTVPRKGAVVDKSIISSIINDTLVAPTSSLLNSSKKTKTSSTEIDKLSTVHPAAISSTDKLVRLYSAPVREEPDEKPETVKTKTTRRPKPKPTLTIGGQEADDPIPAAPTDKSASIMPRKIDYIVPVVITFTALPLMGVTFYVLYKRGKDYWSKRHYRRMDFLIDGMYNE